MPKSIIIIGTITIMVLLIGSYFLFSGGTSEKVKILSYQSTDGEKPTVEAKKTFVDVGQIKVSDKNESEFRIKNVGKQPLQLFNISSSCGCTVGQVIYQGKESKEFGMHSPSDFVTAIDPQKEAVVRVIYRPFVMPIYGAVEREVYISTNDPNNSKLVFKVKAYVK